MKIINNNWLAGCLAVISIAATTTSAYSQACSCSGDEQKVRFYLRGVTSMAGSATVTVSYGDFVTNTVFTTTNTIVGPDPNGIYSVDHYDCVEWSQVIMVEPRLDQPITVAIQYVTNNLDPGYSEFQNVGAPNPLTYFTKPSSPCLRVQFDSLDEDWVQATTYYGEKIDSPAPGVLRSRTRLKGVIGHSDSNLGDSGGLISGGGAPVPDVSNLTDSSDEGLTNGLSCPGSSSGLMAKTLARSTAGTTPTTLSKGQGRGMGMQLMTRNLLTNAPVSEAFDKKQKEHGKKDKKNAKSSVSPTAKANVQTASFSPPSGSPVANGYTVATPIGRLRWEMSLGSVGQTFTRGRLIYQADALDATAYSPVKLSLAAGSDPLVVSNDNNGFISYVTFRDGSHLNVSPLGNGFQVAVSPSNGAPALTWLVENPDASPAGRVRFTKNQGTNSEVHMAQWQGTAQSNGTMTITRFGTKWKEVREYSLASGNTQRVEMVSEYKNNVLQHKFRETYQEFYNWGNPGDVFEALVEKVEDPDGQALTTTYIYWDTPSQPGNELYQATYPDGYSTRVPYRYSGNGYSPVLSSGGPQVEVEPYENYGPSDSAPRVTYFSYANSSSTTVTENKTTAIAGIMVGYETTQHYFYNGWWDKTKYSYTDDSGEYTQEQEISDLNTGRTIYTLDRNGRTQTFYYTEGYWNAGTEQFGGSGNLHATRTQIINGAASQQDGIANKTTMELKVEDQFGHLLSEETYVSDGSTSIIPANLIDRKIYTYTDDRLTATHQNGRLTYQASYNSDGTLQWEEDVTGHHTDYAYDELKRVSQRILRGRGGDADRVTSYDYDVFGNRTSEITIAGGLTNQNLSVYNLAGELTAVIGTDGLTNRISTSYAGGSKVVTETLPTQATKVTTYFKDRNPSSITGTAVEDEYYDEFLAQWYPGSYREITSVYRDSGYTQFKQLRAVNWLGNEILRQTQQFGGAGYRNRYTDYDVNFIGFTRQLVSSIADTGRATQLFTYDELGQLTTQGLDLNSNSVLEAVSKEPITVYDRQFTNASGVWEDVTTSQRYLQDSNATLTLLQRTYNAVPAALAGNIISSNSVEFPGGGIAISSVVVDTNSGNLTTLATNLESGQSSTRIERDGLVRSEAVSGIAPRTYTYTALGESLVVNDPVSGNVTNTYDTVTRRLLSVSDGLGHVTAYAYFPTGATNAGRVSGSQDAAGNWTYFDYNSFGQVFRQWGVNIYPVQQMYDEAGRMTNLTTFRTSSGTVNWASSTWPNPSGGDSTKWIYDQYSGLLAQKVYADNHGVGYGYDANNILTTKTNGRNQVITYSINGLGQLTNTAYSDGTPAVAMGYDRAGRLQTMTDASGTRTMAWTDRDQMGNETYTNGLLAGVTVTRGYDAQFRPSTVGLSLGGTAVLRQHTVFDGKSWVDYINDETPDGATVLSQYDYSFKPNTPYVQTVAFSTGGGSVLNQGYTRDALGRLAGATATAGGNAVSGVNYLYDALNRRFEADLADGTKWNYGYNNRSEVTSGKRQLASSAMAGGEQFEYNFDDIGNRTLTKAGGDGAGNNLRVANYTNNQLNQITGRNVPGSLWLVGEAPTNLTLRAVVQSSLFSLTRQDGQRFYGESVVTNSATPVAARLVVSALNNGTAVDVEKGVRRLAQTPETFGYDNDGNPTQNGLFTSVWDAENRALSFTSVSSLPATAQVKVDCVYDGLGRRVQKVVSVWNPGTLNYQPTTTNLFIYDGWNLIAILDSQSSVLVSFTWGLDLSGTKQGAGGVGGLLGMTIYSGPNAGSYYYSFDGNGNVLALVNAATGAVAAQYEYGPFGELIRASGPLAYVNPFRFSTKFQDDETGLNYYGYRYYDPNTGRWLGREPLGESESPNLYNFVSNEGIDFSDLLGLARNASGHTYPTFLTVGYVLGQSDDQAMTLAIYASMPDTLKSRTAYAPGGPAFKAVMNFLTFGQAFRGFDRIQRYLHSLDGGDPVARRKCLTKMLEQGNLEPWQEGFLIHALGDAYFHVHTVNGVDVLYDAPFGHAHDSITGNDPDLILLGNHRQTKFQPFINNLATALNHGALNAGQQSRLNTLNAQVQSLPQMSDGEAEDEIFLNLANEHGYGNKYIPVDGISVENYIKKYGRNYAIPSDSEVQKFLKQIQKICACKKQ